MLRRIPVGMLLVLLTGHARAAGCVTPPPEYAETCNELQRYLGNFETAINSKWDGQKTPAAFSAELLSADDNRGLHVLLNPDLLRGVSQELDALKRVGVQAITFPVGFPILYQPFYRYNHDPDDYATVLKFYKGVIAEIRRRGMKVVIETSLMFPNHARDIPLSAYYATLSGSELSAGRAQVALTVAQELQPDWLNLGSEPETQSALLRRSVYTPQEYAALISTIVAKLRSAGISGTPLIGAGIGTWQKNGIAFIQALAATGVDYLDFHVFSLNLDFLGNTLEYLDAAHKTGKGVAVSETWLKKVTDAELQGGGPFHTIKVMSEADARNYFSFWQPLDAEFLEDMVKFAHWQNLYYLSPFPTRFFLAYLDYDQAKSLGAQELLKQNIAAQLTARRNGTLSVTGKAYAAAIAGGGRKSSP